MGFLQIKKGTVPIPLLNIFSGDNPMTTELFITDLFYRVDDRMKEEKKHSQSTLYPSEIVTLALLFSIKGVGGRPSIVG